MAGRIERGEIRLHRFSRPDKERPVVVLTSATAIQFLSTVTIAPITSAVRGVASEVFLTEADGMKGPCAVNLHNIVTIRKEDLGRRVASLSHARMAEVCAAIGFAFGCHSTPE